MSVDILPLSDFNMKKKSLLKSFFVDHYLVKIFSLCCAVILWFYVVIDNVYEHTFHVKLRVTNLSQEYILTQSVPETIPVRFKGLGKTFFELFSRDMILELDLSNQTKSGKIQLDLSMLKKMPREKSFQPLRIERVEPIEIRLDRFAQKKIPVVSHLNLRPKQGFVQVGALTLFPDSITVSGSEKLVNPIQFIGTVSYTFENLNRDVKQTVSLTDSLPSGVTLSHRDVAFTMDIQRIGERIMSGIPVRIESMPASISVQVVPSTLSLKLQGGVDILKDIDIEDIVASIDYRNRRRYSGRRIPAMIAVPDEVTFSDVKPKDFELLIER